MMQIDRWWLFPPWPMACAHVSGRPKCGLMRLQCDMYVAINYYALIILV